MNKEQIKLFKERMYQIDTMYSKAKAQILMNAMPIYIINEEEYKPNITRIEYDENTKHLLDVLSKEHCDAIKSLAQSYGLVIESENNKIVIESENNKEVVEEVKEADPPREATLEEAIILMLGKVPIECVEFDEHKSPTGKTLFSSKAKLKVTLVGNDGVAHKNVFEYSLEEIDEG